MQQTPKKLYRRREEYKAGWVNGFYGCRLDDGAACRGRVVTANGCNRRDAELLFWLGYRDGKATSRLYAFGSAMASFAGFSDSIASKRL